MLIIVPLKHCIVFAYFIATLPQFILFIRIYRVTIRTWLHDWQIKTLGDSMSCTVRLFETAAPLGGLIPTPLLAKMWIYASTKHVWSLRDYQADLRAGDLQWIAEILNYVLCCGKHIHDLFRDVCFNIFWHSVAFIFLLWLVSTRMIFQSSHPRIHVQIQRWSQRATWKI